METTNNQSAPQTPNTNTPNSEFINRAMDAVTPILKEAEGSSRYGITLVVTDLEAEKSDGMTAPATAIGISGHGRAIIGGLKEVMTNPQTRPLFAETLHRIAAQKAAEAADTAAAADVIDPKNNEPQNNK